MILGIGNDLIDIRRIDKTIKKHGERFLARVYTDIERAKSDRRAQRAASYAKRFAAKEACAKALGTGLNQGVYWRDMGVVNLPGGKRFTVETVGLSDANHYVGKVELNGKPLARSWISDAEIRSGGTLRFTMQAKPDAEWGKAAAARPYSLSTARRAP